MDHSSVRLDDQRRRFGHSLELLCDKAPLKNDTSLLLYNGAEPKNDASEPKNDKIALKNDTLALKSDTTAPKDDVAALKNDASALKNDATAPKDDATEAKNGPYSVKNGWPDCFNDKDKRLNSGILSYFRFVFHNRQASDS